jgi:hypothetical protein
MVENDLQIVGQSSNLGAGGFPPANIAYQLSGGPPLNQSANKRLDSLSCAFFMIIPLYTISRSPLNSERGA